jgi:hypothetical protein
LRKKPPNTARRGDGSPLGRTPGLDDDPGLALRCSVSVYRDPQRPEAPPEEIERFVLARYSTRWQWVTVATGILLMLPLARALVLGMSEGYAGFGAIAAAGAILIVMVQVMMRPKVTLEANYTRGELVVQPWRGAEQRVRFEHIEYVDINAIPRSEMMRLELVTGAGRVLIMDTMVVDATTEWLEGVRANAAQRSEAPEAGVAG